MTGENVTEEWRAILGYEGRYEVSDRGRVRSIPRSRSRGGLLRLIDRPDGYRSVSLWKDNAGRMFLVHRLVAQAFCTRLPGQNVVRHLNGDKDNNSARNVAWGTSSDNNFDTVRHGRHFEAQKTHCDRGHRYDERNTGYRRNGRARYCRSCIREDSAKRYATIRQTREDVA